MTPLPERILPEARKAIGKKKSATQLWDDALSLARARWHLRNATSVGERVRVWGRPVIRNEGSLIIDQRVSLISGAIPIQLTTEPDGRLEIGARTFMNYGCSILATKLVSIGPDCKVGMEVLMMDNDFHQVDPHKRWIRPSSAPIVLEENVWLGARVIVLSGVTIGANSVIAAGSVVTRDIPPRSFAAGQPARVIKSVA
ncbi:acyltransferase [Hyphomicrobium facile]|uniref:Maltose O-acetyltransferase n=1 Tax=Hyphomicrobium facile TaxID=51670 RepID=A0A1I7NFL2_9HYPH|nr:acyltransferase [Hyphomicrobium facile]SFV33393.1 maltose O-acetyltransferase [Hyphomicrobium facile]